MLKLFASKFLRKSSHAFTLKAACAAALFTIGTSHAQNQQKTWTLPPNKLSFTANAATPIPSSPTGQYFAANGAYDATGNLLFYVRDLNVYKADGSPLGTLQPYTTGAAGGCSPAVYYNYVQKEIAIVPKQGTCNQFYVVWLGTTSCVPGGFALRYATVTTGASPSLVENFNSSSYLDFVYGQLSAGLAVGTKDANGTRKMYVVTSKGARSYTITGAGISLTGTGFTNWSAGFPAIYPSEVELNPSGTVLAWGNALGSQIASIAIDPSTKEVVSSLPNQSLVRTNASAAPGVEFAANGDLFYSVGSGTPSTNPVDGIYKVIATLTTSNLNGSQVLATTTITQSHLELAYDGYMYAANSSGLLTRFSTSTFAISSPPFSVTTTGNSFVGAAGFYSLPDQVDGEDYTTYRGIGALNYSYTLIYCNTTALRVSGNIYATPNCATLTLSNVCSNYQYYNLTIFTSNSSGTPLTQLYTSGTVSGTYPTAQDIGGLGTNNIHNSPPGYFLIRMKFGNGCDPDQSQDYILNATNPLSFTALGVKNTAPVTLANGNYKVYTCNAITLAPTSTGTQLYKLTLQSATSTGQIVSGAGTLSLTPSTFTAGAYPAATDLRTWPGTSNFIQNMTSGYILATLELKDNCSNPSNVRTALLYINSLGLGSADFIFNKGDGTPVDPDNTSLAVPGQVGQYGLGINPQSSTGYLDTYTMKIEKVNQSDGSLIQTVCNYPAGTAVPSNSASNLPLSIGLNGYASTNCSQTPGYFAQGPNQSQVYRLSLVVTNACGTSAAKVGYFQNSNPNLRMDGSTDAADLTQAIANQGHALYPNPSSGKATIYYLLDNPTEVSLEISDFQGNVVHRLVDNVVMNAGTHIQAVDISSLPDGIYTYQLKTDKVTVGKFIKTAK